MPAPYDPSRDVIVRELAAVRVSAHEEILVRIRRYDHADGSPGVEKLEVSSWKIRADGSRKASRGARLEKAEVAALLAALLELPTEDLSVSDDWTALFREIGPLR